MTLVALFSLSSGAILAVILDSGRNHDLRWASAKYLLAFGGEHC